MVDSVGFPSPPEHILSVYRDEETRSYQVLGEAEEEVMYHAWCALTAALVRDGMIAREHFIKSWEVISEMAEGDDDAG